MYIFICINISFLVCIRMRSQYRYSQDEHQQWHYFKTIHHINHIDKSLPYTLIYVSSLYFLNISCISIIPLIFVYHLYLPYIHIFSKFPIFIYSLYSLYSLYSYILSIPYIQIFSPFPIYSHISSPLPIYSHIYISLPLPPDPSPAVSTSCSPPHQNSDSPHYSE